MENILNKMIQFELDWTLQSDLESPVERTFLLEEKLYAA